MSFVVTRCHSLSLVVPLVVTHCTTRCHSFTTCCTTRCHLLSLYVSLVCLFINDLFKPYYENKKLISSSKKGEQVDSWRWTRNSYWKNRKNGKRPLLTYLEKCRNCQKFCDFVRSPMKGLKKNGVTVGLEFIKVDNYFYFDSFISFFETVLFTWHNQLESGVHNLYSQYHLIYP